MIRTSRDLLFVQPLPAHLAKRVRRRADSSPHLIYRLPPGNSDALGCQTKTSGRPITFFSHIRNFVSYSEWLLKDVLLLTEVHTNIQLYCTVENVFAVFVQ